MQTKAQTEPKIRDNCWSRASIEGSLSSILSTVTKIQMGECWAAVSGTQPKRDWRPGPWTMQSQGGVLLLWALCVSKYSNHNSRAVQRHGWNTDKILPMFPPKTRETQEHASGPKEQRHVILLQSELEPRGSEVRQVVNVLCPWSFKYIILHLPSLSFISLVSS